MRALKALTPASKEGQGNVLLRGLHHGLGRGLAPGAGVGSLGGLGRLLALIGLCARRHGRRVAGTARGHAALGGWP